MRRLLLYREGPLCCDRCVHYEGCDEYYDTCACNKNDSRQELEDEECCPECHHYEDCYLSAVHGGTAESAINREIARLLPKAFDKALKNVSAEKSDIVSKIKDMVNVLRQEKEAIGRNIEYMVDIVASTKKYYYQYAKDKGVKMDDAKIFPIPEGGIKHE